LLETLNLLNLRHLRPEKPFPCPEAHVTEPAQKIKHLTPEKLLAGLDEVRNSPQDNGTVEMIVIRPTEGERVVLDRCEFSAAQGIHGDRWPKECWKTLPDGRSDPDVQLTLTNSRNIHRIAQDRARWSLSGDGLYVDLDLSEDNIPRGQRLAVGSVILEATAGWQYACGKYVEWYGRDAAAHVNSALGKQLRLRGIFAKIVQDGIVTVGDVIRKI